MKIEIINGPNLNLLGIREPKIYGYFSFEKCLEDLKNKFSDIELNYYQSNIEGELINRIHEIGFSSDGIILNAGAYTHTSLAIHDAIKSVDAPIIEVHVSNIFSRETFRHQSIIAGACKGVISGFGIDSYRLAIESIKNL